jgi:hypothetical protein
MRRRYGEPLQMKIFRPQWVQLTVSILLLVISAFCLLKYLAWASVFSGSYGLSSQAKVVALARTRSLAYLWAGLLAEGTLVAYLVVYFKLNISELSGMLKFWARLFVALAVAGLGTFGVAFLLDWLGKITRHSSY